MASISRPLARPFPVCPDHRDQAVVSLDDPLRLDAKLIEALQPAAQEPLEALTPLVAARVRAWRRLVPLDVWVQQLEHDGRVAAVERGVPTL